MMFDGGGTPLPVVYCEGESEINLGIVVVDPSMNFKRLVSLLSHKIGISPHQLSVFLADKGNDRKIPLTAKINLPAVCRDGGAYYLFVKRSRRSKKPPANNKNLPEKVMLLRRDGAFAAKGGVDGTPFSGFRPTAVVPPPILDRVEFERRMRNLWMERESFLMSMDMNAESLRRETPSGDGGGDGGTLCEECLKAKLTGIDAGFHLCVHDEVVVGFRSPAGPISRPAMNPGKDGH